MLTPHWKILSHEPSRTGAARAVEQVKAGLSQARSQGKRLGRQPVSAEVVERIRDESATGADILKTTKDLASASGEYIG